VLALVGTDVLADAEHQRAEEVPRADDEAQLLTGVEGDADREQVDLDVDDLSGHKLLDPVEAVSRHLLGRQRIVEVPCGDAQPPVGALVPKDGGAVVGEVVGPRAPVGDGEHLQRCPVRVELLHQHEQVHVVRGLRLDLAVEPPPLREARSAPLPAARTVSRTPSSLAQVRAERPPQALIDSGAVWDVFISHASDDKGAVARPLRNALEEFGVKVWFDAFELGIGDSLRRKIDQGLAGSTFGVVILSNAFFAKDWPQYELDGLITRSISGQQSILPIWHDITRDEVMAQSPSLADKLARSTSDYTIPEIAEEIGRRARPDLFEEDEEGLDELR